MSRNNKNNFGKCVKGPHTRQRFSYQLDNDVIVDFNCQPNKNFDLVSQIINLAQEHDISIKIFEHFACKENRCRTDQVKFDIGCLILIETIKLYSFPRFIKNKQHLQQMIDGEFYYKKGDNEFDSFMRQSSTKYGGIVYAIKPIKGYLSKIFQKLREEIYIGVTWKSLIDRFIEHLEDAVNAYIEENDMPSRYIEHLLLSALEDYLSKICSFDEDISILQRFIETELLGAEKWKKNHILKNLGRNLFESYFQMEALEVHRNYETAWIRERWNIENYTREQNGKLIKGTLFPKGLNMVRSPKSPNHKSLPLYDIIFAISQGYNAREINKMINKYYDIQLNYRNIYLQLYKFWKNWDDVLEFCFKPVLQILLENKDIEWKNIAKSVRRAQSYRNKTNFKKWFYDLNVTELRNLMKSTNFEWGNLKTLAKTHKTDNLDHTTIKGVPIERWIKWFIEDIGMGEIAKNLGYSNASSFGHSWNKQNRVSIFQRTFGRTYTEAVTKYRRKRAIELLTDEDFIYNLDGSRLYWIYINEFKFKYWKNYRVAKPSQGFRNCFAFFDKLFKGVNLKARFLEKLTYRYKKTNPEISEEINNILNS